MGMTGMPGPMGPAGQMGLPGPMGPAGSSGVVFDVWAVYTNDMVHMRASNVSSTASYTGTTLVLSYDQQLPGLLLDSVVHDPNGALLNASYPPADSSNVSMALPYTVYSGNAVTIYNVASGSKVLLSYISY
jgi:hypothetical protein